MTQVVYLPSVCDDNSHFSDPLPGSSSLGECAPESVLQSMIGVRPDGTIVTDLANGMHQLIFVIIPKQKRKQ